MLNVCPAPIYLYAGFADMRKSFDGLLGLIEGAGLGDPLSGAWFVFRNRRGDRIKILYFDRDGLAIWYKRLEQGRFQWPKADRAACGAGGADGATGGAIGIDRDTLHLILAGIDLSSVHRRKRYRLEA